jgi:hypothetical protein
VQLRAGKRGALCAGVAGLLAAAGSSARADVQAASHLTVFTEPSPQGRGLQVIHPQTEVGATHGALGLQAGYELDIVSGATTRVYRPGDQPDAVSGATFSDVRHAARGALSFETQTVALTAGYSYGWENDYKSHTLSVAARGDFLERNFTLGLAYTRNFDSVCDQANDLAQSLLDLRPLGTSEGCFQASSTELTARRLSIDTFEPSLSWTATPLLLLSLGSTLQILDGFQSNPYRAVRLGPEGREPQERLPQHRQRFALFLRAHQAVPPLRAAARLAARVYRDTWDVAAASADVEWLQYFGSSLMAGVRGRYHKQGGAIFFRTAEDYRTLGPPGEYWTGDRELAPLTNYLVGAKVAFVKTPPPDSRSWLGELEIQARVDFLFYRPERGAPNADRTRAQVLAAGASLRF